MTKDTTWRKRCEKQLEQYVDINTGEILDPNFREHIQYLRASKESIDKAGYPENIYPSQLTIFMRFFKLPFEMKDLLRKYISSNTIDFSLMRASLSIISEYDNEFVLNLSQVDEESYWESYADSSELKIVIPASATINEIIEFIRLNKNFIKEKQNLIGQSKRIRSKQNIKRDLRVNELLDSGLSYKEVASVMNGEHWGAALGHSDIASIRRRSKIIN